MKNLHKFVLVAVVSALLACAFGACKNSGNTLARWGGAAGGAVVGGAIGGPVGAGVGAVAGDAGGDVLVPYEEGPTTTINNGKGGVVYTSTAHPGLLASLAWYVWLALGVALLLAFPRTRGHLLGFAYSAALGHVWSATMKLLALLGLVKSETANATLASARRRRGKSPPAVVIGQEVKPHTALLVLPLLFVGGGEPQPPVGCRVLPTAAPWVAARTMAPALSPPSVVHIEICTLVEEVLGYENRIPDSPGWGFYQGIATTVEVSFNRTFTQPVILPATISTADQVLTGAQFDGVIDYGGTSGQTMHLPQAVLIVADLQVGDPSFFMDPWEVYIRVRPNAQTFHLFGTGPLAGERDTLAALAVTATYQ